MKVLLFGKSGLLGKALFDALSERTARARSEVNSPALPAMNRASLKNKEFHVISPTHEECDVCNANALKKIIELNKPDFVINATGYTQVDKAEEEQDKAFALNHGAVKNFCEILRNKECAFIHFSTDYVFDGKKKDGYKENDAVSPVSTYAKSKEAGEKEILATLKNFYLIRTAWLYGPGGKNFVDTMLNLSSKGKDLRVVNDQIGNPTYTPDLAQALLRLLQTKKYGIYHMVNEGHISWYDYAKEIFLQRGIAQNVIPISSKEFARPAFRPNYSILLNTKFPHLRPWKEALADYLQNKSIIL